MTKQEPTNALAWRLTDNPDHRNFKFGVLEQLKYNLRGLEKTLLKCKETDSFFDSHMPPDLNEVVNIKCFLQMEEQVMIDIFWCNFTLCYMFSNIHFFIRIYMLVIYIPSLE